MTSIFVAGGTGFIGRRFVDAAVGDNAEVQVLTRSQSGAEMMEGSRCSSCDG
jgi:nucleoside-diphosphate-sugar epimerase